MDIVGNVGLGCYQFGLVLVWSSGNRKSQNYIEKRTVIKGAVIERERRYQLWRIWEQEKPLLLFILLNPSLADADANDRTVAKLIHFSKNWGYGGFYLGNLHSFISSNPKRLEPHVIPHEKVNVFHLKKMKSKCEKVIFGWGNSGKTPLWLKEMITDPLCFGTNQNGSPKHPLYLSYKTLLTPFKYK